MLAVLASVSTQALAGSPFAAPRGIISFELEGVMYDRELVRSGAGSELEGFLRGRLRSDKFEPGDAYAELDALLKRGEEFGFSLPGVANLQREALLACCLNSGLDDAAQQEVADEALSVWCQAHDSFAEQLLEPSALPALRTLRERGFGLCAITSSLGNSERMPVQSVHCPSHTSKSSTSSLFHLVSPSHTSSLPYLLPPLPPPCPVQSLVDALDFTLSTFDFTLGPAEAWDVAFQVSEELNELE